jgi:hypothetical protein
MNEIILFFSQDLIGKHEKLQHCTYNYNNYNDNNGLLSRNDNYAKTKRKVTQIKFWIAYLKLPYSLKCAFIRKKRITKIDTHVP